VYIHISDCVENVYELPLLPNNTASEIFLHKSEQCEVLTGYTVYHWCAGLAVTGRIRDIGQNALQSVFQAESGSSPVTATFSC
jgi:hypothetical protein